MKKYVYVAYSKDKYRLPVVVADNLKEVDVIVVLQKWILAKRERSLIT